MSAMNARGRQGSSPAVAFLGATALLDGFPARPLAGPSIHWMLGYPSSLAGRSHCLRAGQNTWVEAIHGATSRLD